MTSETKEPKTELPTPTDISTAVLVVRAALVGVLGIRDYTMGVIQKTWLKDDVHTAKLTFSVGKKGGNGLLQLTKENSDAVLQALQDACQELIAQDVAISPPDCAVLGWEKLVEQASGATPEETFSVLGDASHDKLLKPKKPKEGAPPPPPPPDLVVATLPGHVVSIVPSVPLKSTGSLASITIDMKQSQIKLGKQAQIMIKITVVAAKDETASTTTDSAAAHLEAHSKLQQQEVRFSTAKSLLETQQKAANAEKEAAAKKQQAEAEAAAKAAEQEDEEMVVNIETVSGKIDYDKLVQQFGSTRIDEALLDRLAVLAQAYNPDCTDMPLHRFLRRGIFFSHRDLDKLVACMEAHVNQGANKPILYLYTGRGPSSESMHLGHLIPFLFTQWLQATFHVPLVIQMTDDEKFIFKGDYDNEKGDNLLDFHRLTFENARDILACGFDPQRTFLFSDLLYVGRMYPNIVRIWKAVTSNAISNIFGFDGSANCGKIAFPAIQAAPSFATSFPTVLETRKPSSDDEMITAEQTNGEMAANLCCLIPCAIDQDPYFRMTRDVAHKLVPRSHPLQGKPALIHSKFFPPLQGATGKMSSSNENSAVFLTDTPEQIARKIKEHAYSGGQDSAKQQRALGADLQVDVAYQWLTFFLEDDDELASIGKDYSTGSGKYWSTSVVKDRLITLLQDLVQGHQERRAQVTQQQVQEWMKERSIL